MSDQNGRRELSDVPALVRDARFFRGLSLRDAANEMGISAATLSRVEAAPDQHTPDWPTMCAIARWLKLEIVLVPTTESSHGV